VRGFGLSTKKAVGSRHQASSPYAFNRCRWTFRLYCQGERRAEAKKNIYMSIKLPSPPKLRAWEQVMGVDGRACFRGVM
jgi:hypothetical protein